MGSFECALPIGPPHRMARNILIGRDGKRFINEDTYTGRIGHQALAGRGGDIYMVVSEDTFEVNFVGMRIQWAAETPEELAADIGVPADALAETIAAYNAGAERGEDPEWHKEPEFLVPLRPPLGAIDLRVESKAIYATFTLGGLTTDPESRVLDAQGRPIAGLYAAGNDMTSVMGGTYPGAGITIGPALTFGYIAARHAAGVSA